jgi:hypothetical protein
MGMDNKFAVLIEDVNAPIAGKSTGNEEQNNPN